MAMMSFDAEKCEACPADESARRPMRCAECSTVNAHHFSGKQPTTPVNRSDYLDQRYSGLKDLNFNEGTWDEREDLIG
ncbi:hypothetical protein [Burkholderia vietnamiensis]|uniref:hypothetical protein n=1 Tax=Burkholderia vietnamiensis TaxID=60552 RepID=UPI001BA63B30|nr:hypothetical protein [Burkholderia vietnamiensis]